MRPGDVRSRTGAAISAGAIAMGVVTVAITASMACGERSPGEPSPVDPSSSASDSSVRQADDFGGRQLFPADNWWNQDISERADRSAVERLSSTSSGARGRAHPDFGPPPYGIPVHRRRRVTSRVAGHLRRYGSESDTGFGGQSGYPIPERRKTTAQRTSRAASPAAAPAATGICSSSIAIAGCCSSSLPRAGTRRRSAGRPASGAIFDLASNARRPEGWTSADAAGLAILPGLVRYDEAVRGPIRHALRVTVRATNGYVWPASHRAGASAGALPMGARLRLKASKDLSSYPAYIRNIFRGMQTHGLIVADNGTRPVRDRRDGLRDGTTASSIPRSAP